MLKSWKIHSDCSNLKSWWNPEKTYSLNAKLFSTGGMEEWHCSFDSVGPPAGSPLLGDCMDSLCQVAHVPRGHACHGNPAVLGHVDRKLLRQTLNLQEQKTAITHTTLTRPSEDNRAPFLTHFPTIAVSLFLIIRYRRRVWGRVVTVVSLFGNIHSNFLHTTQVGTGAFSLSGSKLVRRRYASELTTEVVLEEVFSSMWSTLL